MSRRQIAHHGPRSVGAMLTRWAGGMRHPSALAALALVVAAAAAGGVSQGGTPGAEHATLFAGPGPGSFLVLEGSSNVHPFECRTTTLTLALARDPAAPMPAGAAGLDSLIRDSGVRGLELEIPVASLHSEKKGLDKNMYRAMKTDSFPAIGFHMTRYALAPRDAAGDTLAVSAEGLLTVAGRTRPVTLAAILVRAAQGLWLEGSHGLRMTDYGIRPPTMMLGALRVADPVTVRYRLLLTPGGAAAGGHREITDPKEERQ